MKKEYSIAEARNHLSEIVHQAEAGKPVKLTRRGKAVAVLVAEREFMQMAGQATGFWDAWSALRRDLQVERVKLGKEIFQGLRATDRGRDVTL